MMVTLMPMADSWFCMMVAMAVLVALLQIMSRVTVEGSPPQAAMYSLALSTS